MAEKRLFVPLCSDPFKWFKSGKKTWELRRMRGQFTLKTVTYGRPVELRRGYSTPDSLFGTVGAILIESSLRNWFHSIHDFKVVIPIAETVYDAIEIASEIMNVDPDEDVAMLGFQFVPNRALSGVVKRKPTSGIIS